MKVLIVAETDEIIEDFSLYYSKLGYDIIKYRWLMKALDNVEEIEPEIVVLSALDYPRHWKTFVQYLKSPIIKKQPEIILVTPEIISNEERQKASILGIQTIINDVTEMKETKNTKTISQPIVIEDKKITAKDVRQTKTPVEVTKEPTKLEEFKDYKALEDIKFIFTLPNNNSIINGKVVKFDYPTLHFIPSNKTILSRVHIDQIIPSCTLKTGKFVESMRSQIRFIGDYIDFTLLK